MIGAYIRVSTQMQSENDSIQNQRKKAMEFGIAQNDKIKIYMDVESGSNPDRENWTAFKNDIVSGKISIAWVNELDRSNRNLTEASAFWDMCSKLQIPLWISGKQIDYQDDGQYWQYGISSIQNAVFLRQLSRKVVDAKTIAWADGRKTFRQLYGYEFEIVGASKKNKPIRVWKPVDDEVDTIKKIYSWYLKDKMPLIKICQRLNEMGIRSKNGKYWATRQIYNLLHHVEYTGFTTDKNGNEIPSKVYLEKIVTLADYHEIQKRWKTQSSDNAVNQGRPANHMASGILKCARCGCGYFFHQGTNGYQNYYHANELNSCSQTKRTPTLPTINYILRDVYFQAMLESPEKIYNKIKKEILANKETIADEITTLTASIAKTDGAIKKLIELFENGFGDDVMEQLSKRKVEKQKLEARKAELEKKISAEQETLNEILGSFSADNLAKFDTATEQEQRSMLAAICAKVEIDGDTITIQLIDKRKFIYSYDEAQKKQRREKHESEKLNEKMRNGIEANFSNKFADQFYELYWWAMRGLPELRQTAKFDGKIKLAERYNMAIGLIAKWMQEPDGLDAKEQKVLDALFETDPIKKTEVIAEGRKLLDRLM